VNHDKKTIISTRSNSILIGKIATMAIKAF
jgi:hypothetical protein